MKRLALGLGLAMAFALPLFAQQQQGPQAVRGTVTAKGDKSLDVNAFQRGQNGGQPTQVAMKVTLADDTQYGKVDAGTAADLTQGFVVVVVGAKEGAKVTASGVLRLKKGEVDANARLLAVGAARMLRGRGQQGQQPAPPTVGILSSVNPLKVKTAEGEVEVAMGERARVMKLSDATLADVAVQASVIVVPKEEAKDNAVTARAVLIVPAMGGRGGQGGNRQQ